MGIRGHSTDGLGVSQALNAISCAFSTTWADDREKSRAEPGLIFTNWRCTGLRAATLFGHRRGGSLGGLGVSQVVIFQGFERVVELVHERDAGWDIQLNNGLVRDVVEVLHERAKRVPVGRD